ncbi:MAG: hypothetical protein AB7L66_14920 [Gemmatimonadales bacterium]
MKTGALVFMLSAWALVLGLNLWSFVRLMRSDPANETPPPPGTSL